MSNLFWPFLITFFVVAFVTPYKVHQIPFQITFEQKRAPEGCSFCEYVKRSPAPPPAEPSPSKVTDLAGPQWQLGGRRIRLRRSVETGEGGPVGSKEHLPFILFLQKKSSSRNLWVRSLWNFANPPETFWDKAKTLVTFFRKNIMCGTFGAKMGVKSRFFTFFDFLAP